ncbi:hypothetical protein EDD18DRAFT_1180693, partial [Armillaria luteobubalina]
WLCRNTRAAAQAILITTTGTQAARTAPSQCQSGGRSHPHYHNETAGKKKPSPLRHETLFIEQRGGSSHRHHTN